MWKNRHLSIKTKVRIYEACVLSFLLYGSESWATYRPKLSAFYTWNLRFILGKTWEDKITNEDVFRITDSCPLSSTLKYIRLRWAGHVNHMPSYCMPRLVLHGVLANGIWCKGRPRLRFKDVIKQDIWKTSILTIQTFFDRPNWRQALRNGQSHDSDTNLEKLRAKRLILN